MSRGLLLIRRRYYGKHLHFTFFKQSINPFPIYSQRRLLRVRKLWLLLLELRLAAKESRVLCSQRIQETLELEETSNQREISLVSSSGLNTSEFNAKRESFCRDWRSLPLFTNSKAQLTRIKVWHDRTIFFWIQLIIYIYSKSTS